MTSIKQHTDADYENELHELKQSLLAMAGLIEQMILKASRALQTRDNAMARSLVNDDHRVNRAEIDVDELCLRILARRQPLGGDLRFITRALKMVTDIERMGDLAVNIGERVIDLSNGEPMVIHPAIQTLTDRVCTMVHDVITSFVEQDDALAQAVIDRDDEVDLLYNEIFGDVLSQVIDKPAMFHSAIHVQSVAKFLERMGDHATNLAEQVIFMIRGEDIRHCGHLDDRH